MTGRFYRELENIHINTEKPRSYFIPFESEEKCGGKREASEAFILLNGEWDFGFIPNVEDAEIENAAFPSSVGCPDKMTVPMCWQLCTGRGYDVPQYINQDYPYPVDPPHLPDVIPGGFYRRKFEINKIPGREYHINFEGVSSCFYLWINGKFIGYSQVSHCTSEFDISDSVSDGENLIEVLVVKHCTGSYMEDQDFFRLSGIFRDVYILERRAEHINDIFIKSEVSDGFSSAVINITAEKTGGDIGVKIYSPDNVLLCEDSFDTEFSFTVDGVKLWSAETPYLYKAVFSCGGEYIQFDIGIKRAEIKDRCLLFNGKKIKLRGVNRHDNDPETGYVVTEEKMLRDLYVLKRANVNTIRTSHYPNDPRFLEMCDRLGFIVIDEADLESHGMGYNYGDWYWDHWAYLCDTPEWENSCIDRAERLFERDKNHGCVLMWSLGNESGCGENHRKMANFIRSRDGKAIIHYENAHLEYEKRVDRDFKDISDVESRMYAPLGYLEEYLNDEKNTKPFFYCEYVAAWSTGDIPLHWDGFEEYDNYCGGCVWEFSDHAINIGTPEKPKYRYGGDFGDDPNDSIYCVDGLVYPDRTPRPGYYDMKECYKPFEAFYENGVLRIFNKNYFKPLDGVYFLWCFEHNGKALKQGIADGIAIAPREDICISLPRPEVKDGLLTLTVSARLSSDCEWADKDYETGHKQFILSDGVIPLGDGEKKPLSLVETRTEYTVSNGDTVYTLNRNTGKICSVRIKGEEVLTAPIEYSVFRSYHPSNGFAADWKRARYDRAYTKNYSTELVGVCDDGIKIKTVSSIAAAAMPPALKIITVYSFYPDGKLNISSNVSVTGNAPALPRFGLRIKLKNDFENIKYVGYGPYETYPDRFRSAVISEFVSAVTDNYEHYIKPTEAGAHYKTKTAEISDGNGRSMTVSDKTSNGFLFNAKHYSDKKLLETAHDDELTEDGDTTVNIDFKIHSDNAYYPDRESWRSFDEKEFSMDTDIRFA